MTAISSIAQRLVYTFLASAFVLVMLAVSALSAHAATVGPFTSSACPANNMCLWSGAAFTGAFFNTMTSTDIPTLSVAKSVWNRTAKAVRVYSSAGGSGSSTCFAPGTQVSSTTLTARSVVVLPSTTC
ncbi:MAG: peptidase inhibitor family I36 protein [Actinobacteria bacterium]|nr:peptidase inhibitor family I36 protein [Actinomycetota bacterium]